MVIVDTFNVLHAAGKAGLGRLNAAGLRTLIEGSRWRSDQVVLVNDGPGPPGGGGRTTLRRGEDAGVDLSGREAGVSEVFSASGAAGGGGAGTRDADGVIEALLEREERLGRGRQAVVVSSDKRVRAAAVGARAKGMSSEDFLAKLVEDARKVKARAVDEHGGRPEFALDGGMDPGRTAYWLKEFEDRSASSAKRPASAAADDVPIATPNAQECAPDPDPDDVDMREIMKKHGAVKPPPRDEDDEQQSKKQKRRK